MAKLFSFQDAYMDYFKARVFIWNFKTQFQGPAAIVVFHSGTSKFISSPEF